MIETGVERLRECCHEPVNDKNVCNGGQGFAIGSRQINRLTMVKLTVDLIAGAAQFTNTVKDRELDLRGECKLT